MARTTDPLLRNLTVYSVFIRNHSSSGDFQGLIEDLDRIASLGCDIIWLMPIHPIGRKKRKGSAGSPYAVYDYRGINPEYGEIDDFTAFLDEAHRRNLKVIIDVVFNHTSPDSLLCKVHPEWFWRNPEGDTGNRIGDWSDVIDLDYGSAELWDYQIETLKGWLREGVDGFRCDVAPLLPLGFWLEARDACTSVNPETLWLAETVEGNFINGIRRSGYECLTDTEVLRAFDLSYDYDIYPEWRRLLNGEISLRIFTDRLRSQESSMNDTDLKLRFVENHDQPRAADLLEPGSALRIWTVYSFFAKGTALLYAGQEYAIRHQPELFETDPVDWSASKEPEGVEHSTLVKKLIRLKKDGIVRDGFYWLPEAPEGCLAAAYERRSPDGHLTGLRLALLNIRDEPSVTMDCLSLWPELKDNEKFRNRLKESEVQLNKGTISINREPVILDWGLVS